MALTATTSASGHELARLVDRDLERLLVDQVCLGDRDDACLDAEQPQDRDVLERLRACALGRVDHEQEEVDPGRAGDHRADEALMARHVDQREAAPVRQLERRVAEVDRDPAPLLLREPVRVLARQRPHEPRLAVVDVPGGADRQRHGSRRRTLGARAATARGGDLVDLAVGERAHVEEQAAVAHDPDDGRLAGAERVEQRLLDRAGKARELLERQRSAADAGDRLLDLAADEAGEALGACRTAATGSASIRSTGISARARSGSRARARVPSSAASVSLSARSARWSGCRRSRSISSARPARMPA